MPAAKPRSLVVEGDDDVGVGCSREVAADEQVKQRAVAVAQAERGCALGVHAKCERTVWGLSLFRTVWIRTGFQGVWCGIGGVGARVRRGLRQYLRDTAPHSSSL